MVGSRGTTEVMPFPIALDSKLAPLSRGASRPRASGAKMAPGQPAGCRRYFVRDLFGVGLAGALQCDLVLREGAAFGYWGSLGVGIGLRFRRRLRNLMDVGRVNALDWSDHRMVL